MAGHVLGTRIDHGFLPPYYRLWIEAGDDGNGLLPFADADVVEEPVVRILVGVYRIFRLVIRSV